MESYNTNENVSAFAKEKLEEFDAIFNGYA